jgi:DNA mismatch repair protein MutS2
MIFPSTFEQKLGFDTIRRLLHDFCLGELGRENVDKIGFSSDPAWIGHALALTAEMRNVLEFEERFPAQDYYNMLPALLSIRIPGTYLEPEQLSELRLSLETIGALFAFLANRAVKYPALYALSSEYADPGGSPPTLPSRIDFLVTGIGNILDEKSEIRDTASAELKRIRKEKASKQRSVEHRVVQRFKEARQSGWVPEDAEITVRNGRMVIPMVSAHKRKIQGFVHDESATGQTVYLEPVEIFETNNEIRELEYDERREIVKILIAFAAQVRPDIDPLVQAYLFLGKIDFLRAKARLAIETGGRNPGLIVDREQNLHPRISSAAFQWRGAVHPLLFLTLGRQKKLVVPLEIAMGPAQRILIISGPNAGGKSVCLKTVGLVQYMFQCGLLPTVKEDSEFTIFERIFIDIGDEQSIDNDLSTYTSKLYNLKYFIENSDANTLFLIDELGTGTDPSLGGAIAEATLEAINARGAYGVVTTHYSNLKLLASREPGIVNGAMLFDLKKLKPLYKLSIGKPGSSFALEIAREIGFPGEVLEAAQQKTGTSQLDFDRELQNLEVEKGEVEKRSTELKVADDFLEELIKKYQRMSAELEQSKREILVKARQEAKELLDNSNRLIERTIKEIKESQAEREKTKAVREALTVEKRKLGLGDKPGSQGGEPAEVGQQAAQEQSAGKPSFSTILQPQAPQPRSPYSGYLADLQEKHNNFRLTLDLRGKRVDEALSLLQRYIDDAILLSIHEVRILHGKGNGVLRQVTRDYLRSQKEVKSATDERLEAGGAGVTVVGIRN